MPNPKKRHNNITTIIKQNMTVRVIQKLPKFVRYLSYSKSYLLSLDHEPNQFFSLAPNHLCSIETIAL